MHDDELESPVAELPPNVPPGLLGEVAPDIRKVDGDGPHGLNAGVIQEWTWETTMLSVLLAYVLFFPLAFVILWRSRRVPRNHKIALTCLMIAGIGWIGLQFLARAA